MKARIKFILPVDATRLSSISSFYIQNACLSWFKKDREILKYSKLGLGPGHELDNVKKPPAHTSSSCGYDYMLKL